MMHTKFRTGHDSACGGPVIRFAARARPNAAERAARPRFRRPGAGFTLVEIMIVVAIIAVVFAMGAPGFVQVLQKGPMRQAVSDVVEALGQARAQAILRGVPVEFRLTGEGAMEVWPSNDHSRGPQPELLDASVEDEAGAGPPAKVFSARLHQDIAVTLLELNFRSQMEAEETRVRFYPNGTSDDFTVVMEFGGEIHRIWLDPITALADLEKLR
ncbi:MAG: GspH/FimT family pseudopilin [Verrucomicrobia bacterium]|nr:GspH/FimT family pseudopilin [Verrucomicrobiota bacterium]